MSLCLDRYVLFRMCMLLCLNGYVDVALYLSYACFLSTCYNYKCENFFIYERRDAFKRQFFGGSSSYNSAILLVKSLGIMKRSRSCPIEF